MAEDMQVALIAGGISLIVSSIGVLSSWMLAKLQTRQADKQIRTEIADKLISLRLEHYGDAFDITDKIQRRKEPQRVIPRQELLDIGNELFGWKTGVVSLILSQESIDAFYTLRDSLGMGYAEKENYSHEQVDKIMASRDGFRRSLRHDTGFLHVNSPRLEK